jgi:carbohydrate-selective porin OprB
METFYARQLTPAIKRQPDPQVIWNPAFSPEPGPVIVSQLQIDITWSASRPIHPHP